ncbi:hypothetical protein [Paenibacillus sp. HW567]|uniref:hypothetical protein n=1 Tax=Paenibacillus sp. HW567 TaxID=1034769 RepID=UPI00036BC83F|nr:hypothetical protein [Paenibacillus sp. HW567]
MNIEHKVRKRWFRIYVIVMTTAIAVLLVLLVVWKPAADGQAAAEAEEAQAATSAAADAVEIEDSPGTIPQEGVLYIKEVRQQGSSFENYFTAVPDYGTELKIHLKNNGASGIAIFNVYRGSHAYGFVEVKAEQELTRTFRMSDGSGVSGDWKVYATTRDGHRIDISAEAGQH